jgi:23S rRNA (guanine745-N1)-methyltransferase
VVGCAAGHRFDVARQGYLPLLGPRSRTDTGDDAAMVAAREAFLAGGWYAPIVRAVAGAVSVLSGDVDAGAPVVEVGAGTGYYLAVACTTPDRSAGDDAADPAREVDRRGPQRSRPGLALDASRYALRRAARLPGVAAVLADAWSPLPVRDGIAGAVLSVFAPRDPAELVRILAPGGVVVVVTPETDHLAELRGPLPLLAVDAGKAERVVETFSEHPVIALDMRPVRFDIALSRSAVADLVAMGPTARHLDPEALTRSVSVLPEPMSVTVSVTVTILQRDD